MPHLHSEAYFTSIPAFVKALLYQEALELKKMKGHTGIKVLHSVNDD